MANNQNYLGGETKGTKDESRELILGFTRMF